MTYPKISIVTPSYNQASYLEYAIKSVVEQEYPNLEYIIIDGGSTDDSIEIIKKYKSSISYWISEPDNGLYDALNKGFEKSTGEIMGWLNSDDILHRNSLFTIADIFQQVPQVNWVQGYPSVIDEKNRVMHMRSHRSSKYFFYLKEYHNGEFIQQESTYWRRGLWQKAGAYISQNYKYAGDFELWMRFFRFDNLFSTNALIGGFRMRSNGQMSVVHYASYLKEADQIIESEISGQKLKSLVKSIESYRKYDQKFPWLRYFFRKYNPLPKDKHHITFDFKLQKFTL